MGALPLPRGRNEGIGRAGLANSEHQGQIGSTDVIWFCLHGVAEILKCQVLRWGDVPTMSPDLGSGLNLGFHRLPAGDCPDLLWISYLGK